MKLIYKIAEGSERETGRELIGKLLADAGVREYEIKKDKNGKPHVGGRADIDFNITHSRGFVACVISVGEGRVGIDAEPVESTVPTERQGSFAERFFSKKEKAALERGERSFSEIWTRKEAYLKMLGVGIRSELRQTDTESLPDVNFSTFNINGFTVTVAAENR